MGPLLTEPVFVRVFETLQDPPVGLCQYICHTLRLRLNLQYLLLAVLSHVHPADANVDLQAYLIDRMSCLGSKAVFAVLHHVCLRAAGTIISVCISMRSGECWVKTHVQGIVHDEDSTPQACLLLLLGTKLQPAQHAVC